jgi:hypothetical protein
MEKEIEVMKTRRKNVLVRLDEYQLRVPSAETRTMPESLRREVRKFVGNFVGEYRKQLSNVKGMKKKEFMDKHKDVLKAKIISTADIRKKMDVYNSLLKECKKAYQEIERDERLHFRNTIYGFGKTEDERYDVSVDDSCVDDSWVSRELDESFKTKYGKGFVDFTELLKAFEEKIEEAIIFATITEVYKLIKEYAKFDPYMEKISNLKIE